MQKDSIFVQEERDAQETENKGFVLLDFLFQLGLSEVPLKEYVIPRQTNQEKGWKLYYEYLMQQIRDKRIEVIEESFQKRMVEYLLMSERHQDLEQLVINVELCQVVQGQLLGMAEDFKRGQERGGFWDIYQQMRMLVIVFAFKEREFLYPISQLVGQLSIDSPEEMVVNILWVVR